MPKNWFAEKRARENATDALSIPFAGLNGNFGLGAEEWARCSQEEKDWRRTETQQRIRNFIAVQESMSDGLGLA